eukprot:CAMPEP_0198285382 /NCGR_PEP_ID=MMETSP1449-20131203/4691_1 /TAXON_ID=420275 /ORGANISM="Attheya septentrionalis, Strain CCMP2084" /LENGTH=360 /DNA_ID=CAMNT_0043982789 /DNA_START=15 /DNA_END=1097 /DNA_ORIENTATION=-
MTILNAMAVLIALATPVHGFSSVPLRYWSGTKSAPHDSFLKRNHAGNNVVGTSLASTSGDSISSSIVSPGDMVAVVGRGFTSVLAAKVAARRGYNTWMVYPPKEEEVIRRLLGDKIMSDNQDLELVSALEDPDLLQDRLSRTSAILIVVDGTDGVIMDPSTIDFLISSESLKRVVVMSRHLNGKDMGFFAKASKKTANPEVWDGSCIDKYRSFEAMVQQKANNFGADCTIVRAGTIKGGSCGGEDEEANNDDLVDTTLARDYYEITKKDIITWQLLFDCNVRGVRLEKGDVLPGPGAKAIFTATGTDEHPGDTGRAGIAEAMVRSLELDSAANVDFGVATKENRVPPTDEEWTQLFSVLS